MEKLIVIAGYGYVGKAIESALKTQLDVGIVDPIINNSRIYDFNKPSVVVNAEELIVAKQFRNSFLATKVSFFNQINDLCECLDLDYEQVRQVVTDDERIGESHTMITDERGFGGHCFPKDTEALVYSALHHGCSQNLIQEAIKYNKKIRKE